MSRRSARRRLARVAGRPARVPVRVASHRGHRLPVRARRAEFARVEERGRRTPLRLALIVWWCSAELDRRLAAGEDASTSEAMAARARRITSVRHRERAADGLAGALRTARHRRSGFTAAVAPHRADVLEARALIAQIESRLRAPEPVAPRGVAIVRSLLTDGNSALYHAWGPGALESQLRAAATALGAPGADG